MKHEKKLQKLAAFHGHLGPYLVLGYRMGEQALSLLDAGCPPPGALPSAKGLKVTTYSGHRPPISCLADGLQLSTGCTVGNGQLTVIAGDGTGQGRPEASFACQGKRIRLGVKPAVVEAIAEVSDKADRQGLESLAERLWEMPVESLFIITHEPGSDAPVVTAGRPRVLVLGGEITAYHDFSQMGPIMREFLSDQGYAVELTENRDTLQEENLREYDALVLYTTHGRLTPEQVGGLLAFVARGKGIVALHGALVSFQENHEYMALLGARFLSHPPIQDFEVTVADADHPITRGLSDFTIRDELYLLTYERQSLHVLLQSSWEGQVVPVAWVRSFGRGRVAVLSLGHGPEAHRHPVFRQLVGRAVAWSAGIPG